MRMKSPLWRYLPWHPLPILFSLFVAWVWSINEGCRPHFIRQILDALIAKNSAHLLPSTTSVWTPVAQMLAIWTFMAVLYRAQCWWLGFYLPRLKRSVRRTLVTDVLARPGLGNGRLMHGKVASHLVELPQSIENIYRLVALQVMPIAIACAVAAILMAQVGLTYAFTFLAWLALHIGLFAAYRRRCTGAATAAAQASAALHGEIMDVLQNRMTVAAYQRHDHETQRLAAYNQGAGLLEQQSLLQAERMKILQGVSALAFVYCIIIEAVGACVRGHIGVGSMYQVLGICFTMVGLAWYSGQYIADLLREIGRARGVLDLVCSQACDIQQSTKLVRPAADRIIELQDVHFAYSNGPPILAGLTFNLASGDRVALVGRSGAGKSTLVRLLIGEIMPQRGAMRIAGHVMPSGADRAAWLETVAVVTQEPCLFHRSIAENIRYGKLEASDEEVMAAARLTQAHDFIMAMPQQYETLVGERGACLSAGQKQRVALARAVLRDAPIWILDEPTSALDRATELALLATLRTVLTHKTVLIATHRPALLALMTRQLRLRAGRVHDQVVGASDSSPCMRPREGANYQTMIE